MPHFSITDHELLAYLDEALPVERMTAIEQQLRDSEEFRRRAARLLNQRDQGLHSIGEIWRRFRLSCPTRAELGSYLLGTLPPDHASHLDFHLQTVGCRYCLANLDDLESAAKDVPEAQSRRKKIFQSSAGYLRSSHRQISKEDSDFTDG